MCDGNNEEPPRYASNEQELATVMLEVQQKRFYIDVKENNRGRFIKLAETIGIGGRKNRIILPMSAALKFRDHLDSFVKFYDALASGEEPAAVGEKGQLRSEVIIHDSRRYFLDLKENNRGRYLRVSQMNSRGDPQLRYHIAIPAAGMGVVRDKLTAFIEQFGEGYLDERKSEYDLPEPTYIRAQRNKFFYFDVGQNLRGTFVRITEVKQVTGLRSSITIPLNSWAPFRDAMSELIKKMDAIKQANEETTAAETNAEAPPSAL